MNTASVLANRRAKIAADAQQTLVDFHAGKFPSQLAKDVIEELRQSLNEPEESDCLF